MRKETSASVLNSLVLCRICRSQRYTWWGDGRLRGGVRQLPGAKSLLDRLNEESTYLLDLISRLLMLIG